jgi:LysM repeat protein
MRARRLTSTTAVVLLAFLSVLGTGTYTVRKGDTLSGIAAANGTTSAAIIKANHLADGDHIEVGQRLVVSGASAGATAGSTYKVVRGDTLGSIASHHGTSISAIVSLNHLRNPNLITIGQRLQLPAGSSAASGGTTTAKGFKQPTGGATTHVVRAGQTLSGIASRYGIPVQQIVAANGIAGGVIYTGQQLLLVPSAGAASSSAGGGKHTVRSGDTLSSIAQHFGVSLRALQAANGITNPNLLRIGRVLTVPAGSGGVSGIVCPVSGTVSFMNDWGFPRSGGRFHEGNDLFAPRGRPVVATVSGKALHSTGKLGGNQIKLLGDDGVSYSYTHLGSFGPGGRVQRGQVLGYVGNTGNAAGGPTHVHFEIHPGSGAAVNPYPSLAAVCRR